MDSSFERLERWLGSDADLILIHPPFGGVDRPSLALHLLQAIAKEEGLVTKVLYANLILAAELGELAYEKICYASSGALLGERYFAEAAYGKRPTGCAALPSATHIRTSKIDGDFDRLAYVYERSAGASAWCDSVAQLIGSSSCRAVGFTTTFEQTAAAISLAKSIRARLGAVQILIGGANCEGEMARGLATVAPEIDLIFSGESEETFRIWCREFHSHINTTQSAKGPTIVSGMPCKNMDALPKPDYSDFYLQLSLLLPDSELLRSNAIWLPYETSRGCWWGQKHHCTFCGINGEGMGFRQKSPEIVVSDLHALLPHHPTNRVLMVDNIMPHTYFADLLPQLYNFEPKPHIFYEQKSNLDFRRVASLKKAGIEVIQPGIEALDSELLMHMRKGVRARQNVALLRYALMHQIFVNWNILHSFPGDQIRWYEKSLALLPLISHLCPPTGVFGLSIDRFSPYFDRPQEFGVTEIVPVPSYFDVLPKEADIPKIAYHFEASYRSESRENPVLIQKIEAQVQSWRRAWESGDTRPSCHIVQIGNDLYLLVDTRPNVGSGYQLVDKNKARAALLGVRPDGHLEGPSESLEWALAHNLCVLTDDGVIPLATCEAELFVALDPVTDAKVRQFQDRQLRAPTPVTTLVS